jgi:hypothetical protein
LTFLALGSTARAGKTVSVPVSVNTTTRTATGSFGTAHNSANHSHIGCMVTASDDGLDIECDASDGTNSISTGLGGGVNPDSTLFTISTITSDSTITFTWDSTGLMTSLTVDNSSLYAPKTTGALPGDGESVTISGGTPPQVAEGDLGTVRRSADVFEEIGCYQEGGAATRCQATPPGSNQTSFSCNLSVNENTFQMGGELAFTTTLLRGDSRFHMEWHQDVPNTDPDCWYISVENDSRFAPKW